MLIDTFVLGDFATNCYVVRADKSVKGCFVIDPGLDCAPLIQALQNTKLNVEAIFLTHGHIDHIAGVEAVRAVCPRAKVYIHRADADMLTSPELNLSAVAGTLVQARPADILLDSEISVRLAGVPFELFHVPGHTPGGLCLYSASEKIVFVGDCLFAGSIGRSDFPGGDGELLITGIKQKLFTLPADTKVFPGHGPTTTIRSEIKYNPFFG